MTKTPSTLTAALALASAFALSCSEKCGEAKYDPEKQFCAEDKVYEKCGKSNYNPDVQICINGKIAQRCGDKGYNSETHFCDNSDVVERCGGQSYIPKKYFCSNSKVYEKCNGEEFDAAEKYCYKEKVKDYAECGGAKYQAETHFCAKDSTVWELCGGKKFDTEFKMCIAGKVTDPACNGKKFNAATNSCINGVLLIGNNEPFDFPKKTEYEADYEVVGDCRDENLDGMKGISCCENAGDGGDRFETKKALCAGKARYDYGGFESAVYQKCSGKEYDPMTQVCMDGKLIDFKCDNEKFAVFGGDEGAQFCVNDQLYGACVVYDSLGRKHFSLYNPKKEGCCGKERELYSLETHACIEGVLEDICGGKLYSNATHACENGVIVKK